MSSTSSLDAEHPSVHGGLCGRVLFVLDFGLIHGNTHYDDEVFALPH
jgi:hypothetical protein